MVNDDQQKALIPITDALPMLQAERYAKVREWDEARMHLQDGFEAADGEYLAKIRDGLKSEHGAWYEYLRARSISPAAADRRIRKAQGLPPYPSQTSRSERFVDAPSAQGPQQDFFYDDEPAVDSWPDDSEDLPTPEPIWEPEPEPAPVTVVPSVTTYSVESWAKLHLDLQAYEIEQGREGKAGLNRQDTDNIEWARWSWNPVTGCLHNCPYCYARDIANRFYPQKFAPTFHPYRLGAPIHQRVPSEAEQELGFRNIFTCSMADLFGKWVPTEWIEAVLSVVRDCPQWNFLFLTKFPVRLSEFRFPDNAWIGTTVDCQARVKNAERAFSKVQGGIKWLSIEPMLEPLHFQSLDMFDWVVIGGASASNETPAWSPPRHWVDELEAAARAAGCMIYEKTNLNARLREYPGWERAEATLPKALKYIPSIGQLE